MVKESKKMIKLTDAAKEHLSNDETVKFKILGLYDGKVNGKNVVSNGVFIATDKRLLFFNKKHKESFNYNNITDAEISKPKLSGRNIAFRYNNDKVAMKNIEVNGDVEGFFGFLEAPLFDKDYDFSQFENNSTDKIKQPKIKQIKETKCTCSACGKVWYYGKEEAFENFGEKMQNAGNSMSNVGKDMMCCTGCLPALFIPNKQEKEVKDLNKCPECGSKAIKKEVVVHNVE